MRNLNLASVQEATEFELPAPGGYIGQIHQALDEPVKEYLKINWDFVEGAYKGDNKATFDRAGFYPMSFVKSYKDKALPFFKAFVTAVQNSNPGYQFREDRYQELRGKFFGVVIGEEEYLSKSGEVRVRPYVHEVRSLDAIKNGDFKVPGLKPLKKAPASDSFYPMTDLPSNEELPF